MIYSKHDEITDKLFDEYPWLFQHMLGMIWKMSEIESLFVRNLISKNPRLLQWIERKSQLI